MITVGTDIIEIARVRRSLEHPRFLARVFSSAELEMLRARGMSAQTVAGSFCAKEAFAKALGTGFREMALRQVQVLRDAQGKPFYELAGAAKALADEKGLCFTVSISHCKEYATATAVAWCERL